MVPRLSSIGRQAAEQAAAAAFQRRVIELAADQRLGGVLDQQHGRRHRAEPDAGGGADAVLQRQADAAADHGDVHFGARDHAQISVARTRRPRRQREADQDLAGHEIGAAGTGRHLLHRHLAAAVRALHRDDGAGRDHRGHAVAGRRAVAEIAAGRRAPLHLLGADQVDRLQHAGPDLAEARMFVQRHAGDGGADAEAAIGGLLDRGHLGDFLDVDDHARLDAAGAHLHQKIGAASQDARRAAGGGKGADRFIKRSRRQISDFRHVVPRVSLGFAPHMAAALWLACGTRAYTGKR